MALIWLALIWITFYQNSYFLGDLNGKVLLAQISSKRYFAAQITYRHLIAKPGACCGGQDFGTDFGLNGQFVVLLVLNNAQGLKRIKWNIFDISVQKVQIWKFQNFGCGVLFWAVS